MKITKSKLEKVIAEEVKAFLQNEVQGKWGPEMRSQALTHAYKDYKSQRPSDDEEELRKQQRAKEFRKSHIAQKQSGEGLPDWMLEEEELNEYEQVVVTKNGYKGFGRYLVDDEGNEKYLGPARGGETDQYMDQGRDQPVDKYDWYDGTNDNRRTSRYGRRYEENEMPEMDEMGMYETEEEPDMLDAPPSMDEMVSEEIFDTLWESIKMLLVDYGAEGMENKLELKIEDALLDLSIEIRDFLNLNLDDSGPSVNEVEKEPMRPRVDWAHTVTDKWDSPRTPKGRRDVKRATGKVRRRNSKGEIDGEW